VPRKLVLTSGLKAVDVKCSLFQTVIRASDGSLWIMGFDELMYAENSVCIPILVWRPIPSSSNTNIGLNDEDIDDRIYGVPANAMGGLLRKGHNRVSILYPPGQSPYSVSSTRGEYYDIILHKDEAFYLPLPLGCPTQTVTPVHSAGRLNIAPEIPVTKDMEIIDYSSGAEHSVLLTKD
jgi:hypothetical protein